MTTAKEILKRQKKRGLTPKDFEAMSGAYKKYLSRKKVPKGQWERDREPAQTIPDLGMIMARQRGYKPKPADVEASRKAREPQEQFVNLISEGQFKYFDDRVASALLGFVDEWSLNSADNLAGVIDEISDFLKTIAEGEKLTPKEESDLEGSLEKFRKKTMGEFPSAAMAGRFLTMVAPIFWKGRLAQGGFGLMALMGEKVGFKKTADFFQAVEDIGNTHRWADEGKIINEAIEKTGITGLQAEFLKNFYETQKRFPKLAAGTVGATKGIGEELVYGGLTDNELDYDIGSFVSGAVGGGLAARRRGLQMADREKFDPKWEKVIRDDADFAEKRLNINPETTRLLKKYKKDMNTDPSEYMKVFGDDVEDLISIKNNADDLALAALQKEEKTIPLTELRGIIENHYLAAIADIFPSRDLLIVSAILRANKDKAVAKELLKEWNVELMQFSPIKKKTQTLGLIPQERHQVIKGKEDAYDYEVNRVSDALEGMFKEGNNRKIGSYLSDLEEFLDNLDHYDTMRPFIGDDRRKTLTAYKKNPKLFLDAYEQVMPERGRQFKVNLENYKKRLAEGADETVPKISERELRSELTAIQSNAKFGSPRVTDKGPAEQAYSKNMFGRLYHDTADVLRSKESKFYNPQFSENMKVSSNINSVLYGKSRTKVPGLLQTFGMQIDHYADGSPKIRFLDEEKAKKTMQDVLFKGVGRPEGRSLHVEKDDKGNQLWKIKRPSKTGDYTSKNTGKRYDVLEIDNPDVNIRSYNANADTRSFIEYLNFTDKERILDPENFVRNVKEAIVSGAIKDEEMLKALVKNMQGTSMNILKKDVVSDKIRKLEQGQFLERTLPYGMGGASGLAGWAFSGNVPVSALIGTAVAYATWYKRQKRKKALRLEKARIRDKDTQEELSVLLDVEERVKEFQKAWDSRDKKKLTALLGAAGWKKAERAAVFDEIKKTDEKEAKEFIDKIKKGTREIIGEPTALPRVFSILGRAGKDEINLQKKQAEKAKALTYFDDDGVKDFEGTTPKEDYAEDDGVRTIQSVKQPPQPPPAKLDFSIKEEESLSPEPTRGEFLETETLDEEVEVPEDQDQEVQDPEVQDRENRQSRINSFLKQQGAYKRSRRRPRRSMA